MEDFGAPVYGIKNKMNTKSYTVIHFWNKTKLTCVLQLQYSLDFLILIACFVGLCWWLRHRVTCPARGVAQDPMLPTQVGQEGGQGAPIKRRSELP